jgi:hypothetical protein
VIIDIGTGDGRFVYRSVRRNPNKFYIGIDPNVRPLEKISEKIHRKPNKGGAPSKPDFLVFPQRIDTLSARQCVELPSKGRK